MLEQKFCLVTYSLCKYSEFINSAGRHCLVGRAEHTKVPDYNRFSTKKGSEPLHNAVRENTRCRWVYIAYGRVILQRRIAFIVLGNVIGREHGC